VNAEDGPRAAGEAVVGVGDDFEGPVEDGPEVLATVGFTAQMPRGFVDDE